LAAWAVTSIVLFLSSGLSRFFGKRGLIAVERLMGMILTAMAVQMFMTGVDKFLKM
jgi:multiple antibiotic resistance protein